MMKRARIPLNFFLLLEPVISGTKTNKLITARPLFVSFIDVNTKSVITDDWKHEVSITGLLFQHKLLLARHKIVLSMHFHKVWYGGKGQRKQKNTLNDSIC